MIFRLQSGVEQDTDGSDSEESLGPETLKSSYEPVSVLQSYMYLLIVSRIVRITLWVFGSLVSILCRSRLILVGGMSTLKVCFY